MSVTHVEAVGQSIRELGFSEAVASRAAIPQRNSTIAIYASKWSRFCSWCRERTVDPVQATPPLVAEFLLHLHAKKNLSISTIEGYWMAISHTLKHTANIDLGHKANFVFYSVLEEKIVQNQ